jgi:4-amino-4-deoxy-L-arabinose transferase-like glycosyltransferase
MPTDAAVDAVNLGSRECARIRAVAGATGIGVAAAVFLCLLVDPVGVLELLYVGLGTLVAAALVIATGYLLTELSRQRRVPAVAVLVQRLVALAGAAFFVWVRPEVSGVGMPTLLFIETRAALLLPIGMGLNLLARDKCRALFAGNGDRSPYAVVGVGVAAAAFVPVSLLVARHWDVSGWMDSHTYDAAALNIATGRKIAGNSSYMPVYQFGMAILYYVFGHFFFVQQIANVVLAVSSAVLLSLAAWLLFRSLVAAAVVAVLAVFSTPLFYAVHYTQIESWYVPIVSMLLFAWACYWRVPSRWRALTLALIIGIGMNARNQGAVFFGFMGLTPLMSTRLPWAERVRQVGAVCAVVALSLIPWTIRNWYVEGRLSPAGSRSTMYVGILNDRRMGLYGIRYWEGWNELVAEYDAKYPNPGEKERALVQAAWRNVLDDPVWLSRALFWRAVAFYGLLPSGMLEIGAIRPTDWKAEWQSYVFWRTTPLLLVPLSIIALVARRNRTAFVLAGAIAAALSIIVFSASSEDRVSYPLLPMHMLLVGSLFQGGREDNAGTHPVRSTVASVGRRYWLPALIGVGVCVLLCRSMLGARFQYRPILESGVVVDPHTKIDTGVPLINRYYSGPSEPTRLQVLRVGDRVRAKGMISNYMYPPKFAGAVAWVPVFATDPRRETYYYLYLLDDSSRPIVLATAAMSLLGAEVSEQLIEGEAVEVDGTLTALPKPPAEFFLHAAHVKKLSVSTDQLPPFN